MCKRVLAIFAALLLIPLSFGRSDASVEGEWEADVAVKVNLSAKKLGSDSFSDRFTDYLTFDSNGFYSDYLGVGGAWSQDGSKFDVSLNPEDIVAFFENLLWYEYGLRANFAISKSSFKGKESKAGDKITGNGSIILNGIVHADCGDVPGKIKMTIKVKGAR